MTFITIIVEVEILAETLYWQN